VGAKLNLHFTNETFSVGAVELRVGDVETELYGRRLAPAHYAGFLNLDIELWSWLPARQGEARQTRK